MNFTCEGIHFSLTTKNCLSFRVRDLICKQRPGFQEVIWANCYLTRTKSHFPEPPPLLKIYQTVWYKHCCSHSRHSNLKWQESPIRIIWAWSFLIHIREHARLNAQIAAEENKLRDATWIQTLYWLPKQNRFCCAESKRSHRRGFIKAPGHMQIWPTPH